MDPKRAADALTWRLASLDETLRTGFVSLGLICREMRDRQLWRLQLDPETMQPFHSMSAWIVRSAPYSYRHCHSAMTALDDLPEIPPDKLAEIKQCNLAQLRTMSTAVRSTPEVLEAASNLEQMQFARKIAHDYPEQHIEVRRPLRLRLSAGQQAILDEAVALAMRLEGCTSTEEALVDAICQGYIQENGGTERLRQG